MSYNIFNNCFENIFHKTLIDILYSYHPQHIDLIMPINELVQINNTTKTLEMVRDQNNSDIYSPITSSFIFCRQYFNKLNNEVVQRIWFPDHPIIKSISIHDVNYRTQPTWNDIQDLHLCKKWFSARDSLDEIISLISNASNGFGNFIILLASENSIPKEWTDDMKTSQSIYTLICNISKENTLFGHLHSIWMNELKNEKELQEDYQLKIMGEIPYFEAIQTGYHLNTVLWYQILSEFAIRKCPWFINLKYILLFMYTFRELFQTHSLRISSHPYNEVHTFHYKTPKNYSIEKWSLSCMDGIQIYSANNNIVDELQKLRLQSEFPLSSSVLLNTYEIIKNEEVIHQLI